MEDLKKRLLEALIKNQKNEAVRISDKALENDLSVVDYYEKIIGPIMASIVCENDEYACIWLEHQMSGIARNLVELSYRHVLRTKHTLSETKKALIVCPKEEYHELGALMGTYMLEYYGFNTSFLGANTPLETILLAINEIKPDYVVLSVSNPYNLFEVRKAINAIKKEVKNVKIVGAGSGLIKAKPKFKELAMIENSQSILSLIEEEGLTCSPSV